ncbi:hypothetical protein B0H10DRAFT_726053 [Mycena sp. CBHHK59/15]|nr:hypothetical protein B0H10DRAFT_726053 [Mycena sp. CBHHK59/15]
MGLSSHRVPSNWTHRMLLRDPRFCKKVVRLHVDYCLKEDVDEEEEDPEPEDEEELADPYNISMFFQWRARVLPSLQELLLEVPFQLAHFRDVVLALPELCPNLKMLKLAMSPGGYKAFLDPKRREENQKIFQSSGAELESLEELRLPFTGLHVDLTAVLPCLLLDSPKLTHLFLGNPHRLEANKPTDSFLLEYAGKYAPQFRAFSRSRGIASPP